MRRQFRSPFFASIIQKPFVKPQPEVVAVRGMQGIQSVSVLADQISLLPASVGYFWPLVAILGTLRQFLVLRVTSMYFLVL